MKSFFPQWVFPFSPLLPASKSMIKIIVFSHWTSVATSYLFHYVRGLAKAFILKASSFIEIANDLVQQSLPTWFWKWPNSQITIVVYGTAEQVSRVILFNAQTSSLTVHSGLQNSFKNFLKDIVYENIHDQEAEWGQRKICDESKLSEYIIIQSRQHAGATKQIPPSGKKPFPNVFGQHLSSIQTFLEVQEKHCILLRCFPVCLPLSSWGAAWIESPSLRIHRGNCRTSEWHHYCCRVLP